MFTVWSTNTLNLVDHTVNIHWEHPIDLSARQSGSRPGSAPATAESAFGDTFDSVRNQIHKLQTATEW
jgi:hypothetical protein